MCDPAKDLFKICGSNYSKSGMRLIRKDFRLLPIYYDSLTIKAIVNDRIFEDDIDELISIKVFSLYEELHLSPFVLAILPLLTIHCNANAAKAFCKAVYCVCYRFLNIKLVCSWIFWKQTFGYISIKSNIYYTVLYSYNRGCS